MHPIKGFKEIETMKEFKKLPAGGYVIKIGKVEDNEQKNYFSFTYDIAEGEYKDFFKEEFYADKDFAHTLICSYSDKAKKSFKGFITALEKSNNVQLQDKVEDGSLSAKELEGLTVGAILSYEEYNATTGGTNTKLSKFAGMRSVDTIRSGNFKVPETKTLEESQAPVNGFTPVKDEEITFDDKDLPF